MTTAPPTPPGMDRFIISVLSVILAAFVVLCFTGCDIQAKHCRQAEAKLADAIHLCPSIMLPQVRVDTVTIYTKPEAGTGERLYSQASMDSLATICAHLLSNNVDTVEVVRRLVQRVCYFDTITVADSALLLKIWPEDGKVRYWYNVLPQKMQAVVTTPTRTINATPCPPVPRVRSWGWIGLALGFCLGFIACAFIKGSYRHP